MLDAGQAVQFSANFLWMCQGYYQHSQGYAPEWDGTQHFEGQIDPENFNPGYLMRGMHLLPKRGDKPEWQQTQDY